MSRPVPIDPANAPVCPSKRRKVRGTLSAAVEPIALSLADAAAAVGMGTSTLYKVLAAGKGPRAFHVGARRLILVKDLTAWLESEATLQNADSPPTPA
jgi:predicted DNA-binding transcriptional regulator AlpA